MTHESTQQLHHRLQVPDVVETIQQHIRRRVTLAQRHLFQAQSPQVHDRWEHLLASCSSNFEPSPTCTHLTEVTHSLRTASTCPVCGVTFVCLHALRTHVGKSHPEHSAAKTGQGYRERSYRHPDLMKLTRWTTSVCPLQEVLRILAPVCGTHCTASVPPSLSAGAVFICESF